MTEKESKYNEECEADCVVHKLATHNTCVFCSACRFNTDIGFIKRDSV